MLFAVSRNGGVTPLGDYGTYDAGHTVTVSLLDGNTFTVTVPPFAGPHGEDTLVEHYDLTV